MFGNIRHFHFIGIGGIGMSGLAKILLEWGYRVSGSDMSESNIIRELISAGATIHIGHSADNLPENTDTVVYTSAVKSSNPEYAEAMRRDIPSIKRAKLLGLIARHWTYTIGIAGTHGKTTTSAMVTSIFEEAGLEPGFFLGGIIHPFHTNARSGKTDWIIVEADEYDRSFLQLSPHYNIITNIELDHTDIYHTYEDVKNTFIRYINYVPFFGLNILNTDDPGIKSILPSVTAPYKTVGTTDDADYQITDIRYLPSYTDATIIAPDKSRHQIKLSVAGTHNLLNAAAAFSLAHSIGLPIEPVKKALYEFQTVDRRFQIRGTINDVTFIDDYAHHPTELRATLTAARQRYPDQRIVAVFQPHTYTRTRDFFTDFAKSLGLADEIFVLDVYPAREIPIENVTGKLISDAAGYYHHKAVHFLPEKEYVPGKMAAFLNPGDVILFIGAGDITQLIKPTMEQYAQR